MKSKLSEVFSGLRERFRGKPVPPESNEFNKLFREEIEYIQKNKEWLAYDRTLDFLESRHRGRVIETEGILERRGVNYGEPGYEQKFDTLWEERFPTTWEPYKASKTESVPNTPYDKGDFEPEI